MDRAPANTYYLCFPRTKKKLAWNPFEPSPTPQLYARTTYLGGVFQAMEQHLNQTGLTFYLTLDLRVLPSYGPDVVAVIQGDESARIPAYFDKVRATFKCYGTRPVRPASCRAAPSYRNLLIQAQYVRDAVRGLPGRAHFALQRRRHQDNLPPIYPIPLGYANQLTLPVKPIEERAVDVFFAGSVAHKAYPAWSPKRWLKTPKDLARRQMLAGLEAARRRMPGLTVDLRLQSSFRRSIKASAAAYSEGMMDAKVCLVPRGASLETFRFFEAMRYGCVTIAEALPPHWFYEDAPAIQTADWRNLPEILASLLDDPDRLRARHAATRAWWQARCSEDALGRFFADKLNALDA